MGERTADAGWIGKRGTGICAVAVRLAWHGNSYAPRFSLNKAGIFPRFASFSAFLLRLECGLLE